MDDSEHLDGDLVLQKSAASYLAELQTKLPPFLFRKSSSGELVLRRRVRGATARRLCNLLEPFQEWPQLLDPQLASLVRPLQEALVQCARSERRSPRQLADQEVELSLEQAVCKLLYTFCKVRGPKVISRLLENGAQYLECALRALEAKVQLQERGPPAATQQAVTWEEKYVYMLWIAHLLLTPFDLTTVASSTTAPQESRVDDRLQLPDQLPAIAVRLVHVAIPSLTSAAKEREAAVKLLSRLAARPDMLRRGLHDCLFRYALPKSTAVLQAPDTLTPYALIGRLSLLAGLLSTLRVSDLKFYLLRIFKDMLNVANEPLLPTAVSRKLLVKNMRLTSILALQLEDLDPSANFASYVLEDTIDYLLSSLADKDTPVRQAASKALGLIVAKLQPEMAAEVVEAIIGSLDENVLWVDEEDPDEKYKRSTITLPKSAKRDLAAVNPLRWHGLVLALSQLLFQRSAPATQLPNILSALILALSFEQRAPSGSSLGGNVRDAANFGIWSIARKYSTQELFEVKITSVRAVPAHTDTASVSIIQALAAELILAGTLDPAGNIRRGASAALQELVGRHPDTVYEGIPLVQTVDYHAVATRVKAFSQVAIRASKLHPYYWTSLLHGMTGWRGLEAADVPSRRLAAESIGLMADPSSPGRAEEATWLIYHRLHPRRSQDVERRHGLLLAAAALISKLPPSEGQAQIVTSFWQLLSPGVVFEVADLTLTTRRPELTVEAVAELITALANASIGAKTITESIHSELFDHCMTYLKMALERRELVVISAAAKAVGSMFALIDSSAQQKAVSNWISSIEARMAVPDPGGRQGYIAALGAVYSWLNSDAGRHTQQTILEALQRVLQESPRDDVDTRVAILSVLSTGVFHKPALISRSIASALRDSLQDYTVNERGDVGSLIRLQALATTRHLLQTCQFEDEEGPKDILAIAVTLAGEKLDKVRFAAWNCLRMNWKLLDVDKPPTQRVDIMSHTSSAAYFTQLLRLLAVPWLRPALLLGVASSAGSGSESVLRAARSALTTFLRDSTPTTPLIICTTLLTLLRTHGAHDRVAVPLLETWAFLFQTNLLGTQCVSADFTPRKLLLAVAKAHYKSGNVQKLTAALHVYAGLIWYEQVRVEVMQRMVRMLLHPLPKVRNTAADVLYLVNPIDAMLQVNWTSRPADLKEVLGRIRGELGIPN